MEEIIFYCLLLKVILLISVNVREQINLVLKSLLFVCLFQLTQAQTGKFNVHVHVEYEWRLQNEDLDESEDEMEDKVGWFHVKHLVDASWF